MQYLWGDRMDLIGIENEAEFFPSGTLSAVLKEELQDITARWSGLETNSHPVERLTQVASPAVETLRQVRNTSDQNRRRDLVRNAQNALLAALGSAINPLRSIEIGDHPRSRRAPPQLLLR